MTRRVTIPLYKGKTKKKRIISIIFTFITLISIPAVTMNSETCLFAQEQKVEMSQEAQARENMMLTKVMGIVLIAWFGVALYLFTIDRKVRKLEKDLNEL